MVAFPYNFPGLVKRWFSGSGAGTEADPIIPEVQLRGYDEVGNVNRFTSMQKKFRDSFTQALNINWDVVTVGGASATISAGVLTIAAGTAATDRVELQSKETYTIPFIYAVGLQLSQRIANNAFLVEAVSVDATTLVPDGRHSVAWLLDGTTATNARYIVQNGGLSPLASSAVTIPTTASYSILELEPTWNESWFHTRPLDSAAARSQSYVRHQQLPDPNALYKLRIQSINVASFINVTGAVAGAANVIRLTVTAHGAATGNTFWIDSLNGVTNNGAEVRGSYTVTVIDANTIDLQGTTFGGAYITGSGRAGRQLAPATGTNLQVQYFTCGDYSELTVEITGSRGGNVAAMAAPVNVVTAATTPVTSSTAIDAAFPNPHPMGVRAANVNPTAMSAAGDLAGALATMIGALVVQPHALPEATWSFPVAAGGIVNTTDVVARVAAAAGIRNYVTAMQIKNAHPTVATEFVIKDGASTVLWRGHLAAAMNGSADITFEPPLRGSAATAINIACITTGAQVYASLQGYAAP